ncbi:MAG: hypothetical protein GTN62_04545 [Gemmatimonadales bacterium]|nr:hypothetical protein [Gemmatimonadales bacterium]NIN10607.1 hypothetical protein [Gemmatimonadales bacterium]NIN49369.1 hypothetical protein [Gemmatimonadales bacterium]NIP06833.1 hypothetical protein [Gemmatimonadales bacterium]NIR01507.1 hypothetical protein [Gemmatimonadales bacterium]
MTAPTSPAEGSLLVRLTEQRPLVAVELRPPKIGLSAAASMDTWIDMYHSVRRLARHDTVLFLTDNAVGESEEENLRHLVTNLAGDVSPAKLAPFLTCKHALEYCLMYADRAASHGFQALTVLGGDRTVGPPRCVEYAYMLRQMIRRRHPSLGLGGWANPHRDPGDQVGYLLRQKFTGDFYLTQIVSHHDIRQVERFVEEARRRDVPSPGVFGVFLYRSANPATFGKLQRFFPVPAEAVTREFESGLSAEEICARTVRALRDIGVDKVYVSNLGFRKPEDRYRKLIQVLEA